MASARIPYSADAELGPEIRAYISSIVESRKNGAELNRLIDKFGDDDAALSTATGVPEGLLALFRNLVNLSQAELGGVTLTAVAEGQQTNARQIADAMG